MITYIYVDIMYRQYPTHQPYCMYMYILIGGRERGRDGEREDGGWDGEIERERECVCVCERERE